MKKTKTARFILTALFAIMWATLTSACNESTLVTFHDADSAAIQTETTATNNSEAEGHNSGRNVAQKIAQAEFKPYLKTALTPRSKQMHRLASNDSHDNATLGSPIPLNEILPALVSECANKACRSADQVGVPIDTYLFPVKFDGNIKLIMSMYRNPDDGKLKRGYLGNRTLARELKAVFRIWSPEDIKLFISNQTRTYAFSVPSASTPNLTFLDRTGTGAATYETLTPLAASIQILNAKLNGAVENALSILHFE